MITVEGRNNVYAKVVAHSIGESGTEIITYEIQCHRFIWAEFMTHRQFSRNAESTRAIPLLASIATMLETPSAPIMFTAKSSGMQSHVENKNILEYKGKMYSAEQLWEKHMHDTADVVYAYDSANYHKQHAGRLLEPFKMIRAVVTSTEWDNFMNLRYEHRDKYAAQIEIHELADVMLRAAEQSEPVALSNGEWHTPYYMDGYWKPSVEHALQTFGHLVDNHGRTLEEALMISSSCAAQVSYRKLNDSLEKAVDVYEKLVMSQPRHYSAVEHCATPCSTHTYEDSFNPHTWDRGVTHVDIQGSWCSGNFREWVQYRQLLMLSLGEKYMTFDKEAATQ